MDPIHRQAILHCALMLARSTGTELVTNPATFQEQDSPDTLLKTHLGQAYMIPNPAEMPLHQARTMRRRVSAGDDPGRELPEIVL